MKVSSLFAFLAILAISSFTKMSSPEFLYLNSDQLLPLGIELNENGVFYKNFNPNWTTDNCKYSNLIFYCTNENYLSTNHYSETETIELDSLLMSLQTTTNDFYPLLIGNTKGHLSLDDETLPTDLKLFPVAINMAETGLPTRNDTIVVWFKPTKKLKQLLPENINIDDYLKTRTRLKNDKL